MIKSILVHVDSSQAGRQRTEWSFDLADFLGAEVVGVHVRPDVDVPPSFQPSAVERVATHLERFELADAEESETLFAEVAGERNIPSRWCPRRGDAAKCIVEEARFVDLVVVGQEETQGSPEHHPTSLAEDVVLACSQPLIATPTVLRRPFRCRRVLIGWDGSRQAARAVHDAMPLLEVAKPAADILCMAEDERPIASSQLIDHLGRHGVQARTLERPPAGASHGATLSERLSTDNFDLLVMGAFGRPLWAQILFGGATQSVLSGTAAPVLLAH